MIRRRKCDCRSSVPAKIGPIAAVVVQNESGSAHGREDAEAPGVGRTESAVCVEEDIQRRAVVVPSSDVPGGSGRAVVWATYGLSGQYPGRRRP